MTTTALSDEVKKTLFENIRNSMYRYSGKGSADNTFQNILSRHDRFGNAPIAQNTEYVGLTFFSRPKLNLTTSSLRQDPHLALMETLDPTSLMFSIRGNLDSNFTKSSPGRKAAATSPWIDPKSPFNIPLSNLMTDISGWPDYSIETKATESGYFGEDITMARGSDRGRRTYDFNLTFKDIQGGYVASLIFYWVHAMALQMEGSIVPYAEDREANRLNYTCSIYRFVFDTRHRVVTKWAKATGCYPINIPMGSFFDINSGDIYLDAAKSFSVPFKANHVSYMDPRIFQSFNTLVSRYSKIDPTKIPSNMAKIPLQTENNFIGYPFVDMYSGNNEFMFIGDKEQLKDPYSDAITNALSGITSETDSYLKSMYTDSELRNRTP